MQSGSSVAIPLRQLHISHAIQQRMFSAPESRTGALVKPDSAPLALAQALGPWDLPSNCARTRTAVSLEHPPEIAFRLGSYFSTAAAEEGSSRQIRQRVSGRGIQYNCTITWTSHQKLVQYNIGMKE